MAKPLVFQFGDEEISFQMSKIDRSKLYGYKDVEVLGDDGGKCELATLAGDGRTVVGRGGTGIGYLSADGDWCDRSELRPVDLEGRQIAPVASSFGAAVPLLEKVSMDEYLNHNVRAVYCMETEDQADALVEELKAGAIYKFPYSFRGGLEADAGFLLMSAEGHVFFAVGNPTDVTMVGLQQAAPAVEEEAAADEGDLMDFDMI